MTTKTLDAVYEDGVFRPTNVERFDLTEGQKVRIVVEPVEQADILLDMAADVFAELSEQELAEIEHILHRRDDFFGEAHDQ